MNRQNKPRSNSDWQANYERTRPKSTISKPPPTLGAGRRKGAKSTRVRTYQNIPINDIDANVVQDNGCFKLQNQPNALQAIPYTIPKHEHGVPLRYDCFIPVRETYEFFPCEPYGGAEDILGFREYRGVDMIMTKTGAYKVPTLPTVRTLYIVDLALDQLIDSSMSLNHTNFSSIVAEKNAQPDEDDHHRFVYLAENKPNEMKVGDCFIRFEEVHNRMRGDVAPFMDDCELAVEYATQNRIINGNGLQAEKDAASARIQELRQQFGGLLRFRCWTVEGQQSYADEDTLCQKLFDNVQGMTTRDHLELFRVWAELLRKSQGDKLGSKEFFGRYWDAVIPDVSRPLFHDGMKILVSVTYLNYLGYSDSNPLTPEKREKTRNDVHGAVQRVIDAPRLKFKPPLPLTSIIFPDEEQNLPLGWTPLNPDNARNYRELSGNGWRTLEAHPGGLYSILINQSVRDFFLNLTLYKQLWQDGYPAPTQTNAEGLHVRLTKCERTSETVTTVDKTNLSAASANPKRVPTQDRCVADPACSANVALSMAYPDIYSDSGKAKKKRVAEWLHRSAFSYGGGITSGGQLSTPQIPNNLVLGSPETNTLMMRYESFVKRVVLFGNKRNGDVVKVTTNITYPHGLVGWQQNWVGDIFHQYTWLAPELSYSYENMVLSNPHISQRRPIYPMNRETAMLFETLLDKSMEEKCWGWECWNKNSAVADALMESTVVDGDQEELNKEDLKDMLHEELKERDPQV
ncbi:uncharacterized protein FFMR_13571 [Fusarium fujikuroi]|nr:uncharacterized protein FFMR_13571 [Fusarium fujikuroi]